MEATVEVDAFESWWDEFVPTGEPEANSGPCIGETPRMFETYGRDLEAVRAQHQKDPTKVWTLLDCDGDLYIGAGFHYVNRIGYFITEKSWEDRHFQEDIRID